MSDPSQTKSEDVCVFGVVEKARDRGKTTFCVVVFVSAECWSVSLDAIAPTPQKATKGMEGNNKKRK